MFGDQFSLKPIRGKEFEIPPAGIRHILFILRLFFFRIIILNLMYLLFSIPIVTIPASYCAMNKVLFNLLRDGSCFLWRDFIDEFKTNFYKSMILGFIWFFVFAVFLFIYSAFNIDTTLGLALNILSTLIWVNTGVLMNYSFAMLSLVNIKLKDILKNSFIFLLTQYKRNIVLLVFPNAVLFICYYFFPLTIPLLLFGVFSLLQLCICEIVSRPIIRHAVC